MIFFKSQQKMNDLTKIPTAELLAEIKNGKFHTAHGQNVQQFERVVSLSNELNERVIKAGLEDDNGFPIFTKFFDWEINHLPKPESVTIGISIKELHDLLEWMLMKGGN